MDGTQKYNTSLKEDINKMHNIILFIPRLETRKTNKLIYNKSESYCFSKTKKI